MLVYLDIVVGDPIISGGRWKPIILSNPATCFVCPKPVHVFPIAYVMVISMFNYLR